MKNFSYQHKDIIRVFPDLSPRSLVSWAEKEILIPDHHDANGRGTVRKYSFDNVVQAGIIRELMAFGLNFRDIKHTLIDYWKKRMIELKYDCVLIIQRQTFPSSKGAGFDLISHFDTRVWDSKELDRYGARIILESSGFINETDKLVPHGKTPTISGVLIANVKRIYRHVDRII